MPIYEYWWRKAQEHLIRTVIGADLYSEKATHMHVILCNGTPAELYSPIASSIKQ